MSFIILAIFVYLPFFSLTVVKQARFKIFRIMANIRLFHILTEDLDTIKCVSPAIYESLTKIFFFSRIENRRAGIDYMECRLQYYCLHHSKRRRFLSLIHSVHVMACDLYRSDRFSDYMAFDCLMSHLLLML